MGTTTAPPAFSLFPTLREQLLPTLDGPRANPPAATRSHPRADRAERGHGAKRAHGKHRGHGAKGAHGSHRANRGHDAHGDKFGKNNAQALTNQFESVVYRVQTTQVSLSARLQEVAARFTKDGEGGTQLQSFQSKQLEFNFFAETRVEELVRFQHRTEALGEGLDKTQAASLVQASRSISARFEFSLTISGAALNGFNNAVEGAQGIDALFDEVLGLTKQLLDAADKVFNAFFGDFNSDFFGEDGVDFGAQFQQILNDFLGAGGLSPALASGHPAAQGQGQSQGVVQLVQLEFSFEFSARIEITEAKVKESDPLILDLDGDGFELTTYTRGARFDILGNGEKQQTAFVHGGDAFLALDRNGDGVINSGRELFGDQNGAEHGFAELRKLDSNGDGVINNRDRDFGKLLLFKDNGNGITEAGELITLEAAGIEELSLNFLDINLRISGGNRLEQIASFRRTDGTSGRSGDAVLNFTT